MSPTKKPTQKPTPKIEPGQVARLEERDRCAQLVEKLPCSCRFLRGYGVKCQRCDVLAQIRREGSASRG